MKSTRYYNQHAEALSEQYNAIEAETVHRSWVAAHLPAKPGFACVPEETFLKAVEEEEPTRFQDLLQHTRADALVAISVNSLAPAIVTLRIRLTLLFCMRSYLSC